MEQEQNIDLMFKDIDELIEKVESIVTGMKYSCVFILTLITCIFTKLILTISNVNTDNYNIIIWAGFALIYGLLWFTIVHFAITIGGMLMYEIILTFKSIEFKAQESNNSNLDESAKELKNKLPED